MANDLIGRVSTSEGLKVFSSVLDKTFETGRKYADDFKVNMTIKSDDFLPNGIMQPLLTKFKVWDIIKS